MLRKIVLLLVFAFCAFHVTAQSSQKISELLEFQNLTNGQASYLVASCMGLVEENATESSNQAELYQFDKTLYDFYVREGFLPEL